MSHVAPSTSERGSESAKPRGSGEGGGERPLVETDLRVREVLVVEQQQVGLLLADEDVDVGARTVDVDLVVADALEHVPDSPDRTAYRPMPRRCGRSVGCESAAVCSTAKEV